MIKLYSKPVIAKFYYIEKTNDAVTGAVKKVDEMEIHTVNVQDVSDTEFYKTENEKLKTDLRVNINNNILSKDGTKLTYVEIDNLKYKILRTKQTSPLRTNVYLKEVRK